MKVIIEFTDTALIRTFGKGSVEISESRARNYIEKGKARLKSIPTVYEESKIDLNSSGTLVGDFQKLFSGINNIRFPDTEDKLFPNSVIVEE